MARAQGESSSLRFSRRESERLIVALVVSVLLHVTIASVYFAGRQLGWWEKWNWAALHPKPPTPPVSQELALNMPAPPADPEIFVDVSHADADAPVKPKYYSSKNSHAANPDVANANLPKINGRQTDVPLTEDAARRQKANDATPEPPEKTTPQEPTPPHPAQPLQPAPPKATEPVEKPPETPLEKPPETPPTPGETELRKPVVQPATAPATQPVPPRPRTLKQALAQQNQIPGVAMRQDGGVARSAALVSMDAKSTPFGEYDAAIVEAIRQRWYDLLDSHRYAQDRTGKVTVRFRLRSDGTVSEMQMQENTVGDVLGYLCQESVEESGPFAKWPTDMVRLVGANYREVTFTFYYY